jgi:hypothetical protein
VRIATRSGPEPVHERDSLFLNGEAGGLEPERPQSGGQCRGASGYQANGPDRSPPAAAKAFAEDAQRN